MRIYETTFILSPQADDAAFDRQIKSVSELITRYQGNVLHEDRWGIRRLAYPIRKFTQGYYTRMVFEGNNQLLSEMDRFFRIEEPYIRHLTVVFEGSLDEPAAPRRGVERHKVEKPVESKPEPAPVKEPEVSEPPAPEAEVKPAEEAAPAEAVEPRETEKPADPTENEL